MKLSHLLVATLLVGAIAGFTAVHHSARGPKAAASAAVGAVAQAAATNARMDLVEAASSIAAFNADNGGYAGMTSELLRANYDASLPPEVVVTSTTEGSYCIQATVQGDTASLEGPGGTPRTGPC